MSKQTGLAAFTSRKAKAQPESVAHASSDATVDPARKRGKGEVVALTVRISRTEWERLHQLAVAEGTSIQQLAIKGLSKIFSEKGLPGISVK